MSSFVGAFLGSARVILMVGEATMADNWMKVVDDVSTNVWDACIVFVRLLWLIDGLTRIVRASVGWLVVFIVW